MTHTGLAFRLLQRCDALPSVAGRVSEAAAFRLCRRLAASNRPIVRGRIRTGSPITLDVRDPAHREILRTGQTEPGSATLLARLATSGWTVVDVGANAGFFTMLAWDLGKRRGRVLAFEPNPRVATLLRRSIEAADATGVDLIECACGKTTGDADLHLSQHPGQTAFATVKPEMRWSEDWTAIPVRVTTVDKECEARGLLPELVKIDAEGAEGDIIDGMRRLLSSRVPAHVLCEVAVGWSRPDPTTWIEILRDAGYAPFVVSDDGTLTPLGSLAFETIQNVCFTRMG